MAQREIDCQDVSARMMELLYGELPGDDRAAVEAHLAGCPSCRAELAGFESTRAAARRTLDADEPPARAHQAILRAAAAAVAAKQPTPSEVRAVPPRPSFWARWRVRWTLPTFATLGAVAVVALASKVFLEPDKTVELGRQALRPAPLEAPATPQKAAEPQATAGAEVQEPAGPTTPAARERKEEKRPRPQPPATDEAPAGSIAETATRRRPVVPVDRIDALGGTMKGSGSAGLARHKGAIASDGLFGDDDLSAPRSGAAASPPGKREFAPPPPPRAEPARPARPAANQMRERDTEGEALEESAAPRRGGSGQLAAGAGAAPPAAHAETEAHPQAKKTGMPSSPGMDELDRGPAASASAPAPAPPAPAESDKDLEADAKSEARAAPKPVTESPVVRADRLFAQRQWAAAARAYRDLLHRDPHNSDAARWRQRLAAAEQAAAAPAASPRH
jgi:anti-sigma factor RsiW